MESALKKIKLAGRCYFSQIEDLTVLILEDLAPLGYQMADRLLGLDLKCFRLALIRLAQFHASSVYIIENTPNCKKEHKMGLFSSDHTPQDAQFYKDLMDSFINTAETWRELTSSCITKLRELSHTIFPRVCKIVEQMETEFSVINHGDCWINNMMFKYDEQGNVIDHVFVDFQMSRYGTPGIDLQYFFNTSISYKVLQEHKVALMKEYQEVLASTMIDTGCRTRPPSVDYINKMLANTELIGVLTACTALPNVLIDKSKAEGPEKQTTCSDGNLNALNNEAFKQAILPRLDR
ncbi:uncharacterized protein LOC130664164 [Microplitis mediator]|uniref:uncharacterized protein LOC130664164 n=1 Tax=Microplitis mediator TaxID=375433 RepID=UPI0025524409|nr:uncharacterized protein LOC130664164 [Microplitis mediator]